MADDETTISVVGGRDEFLALGPEWTELALRVPGFQLPQTFEWAHASVQTNPLARGATINCVVARRAGVLVGVWGFFVFKRGFYSVAHQIGCGSNEEFGGPLVEVCPETQVIVEAIVARALTLADVLQAFCLLEGEFADVALQRHIGIGTRFTEVALEAPLRSYPTWEEYAQTLSTSLRSSVRYKTKQLQKVGNLTFCSANDDEFLSDITWILEEKQRWLDLRKKHHWLSGSKEFWICLRKFSKDGTNPEIFTLKLDGAPIAGFICVRDNTRIVFLITAFDPNYSNRSPGIILIENCLRYSFERKLDFNFGMAHYDYKERWSGGRRNVFSYSIACTQIGVMEIARRRVKSTAMWPVRKLVKMAPSSWKIWLKSALRR